MLFRIVNTHLPLVSCSIKHHSLAQLVEVCSIGSKLCAIYSRLVLQILFFETLCVICSWKHVTVACSVSGGSLCCVSLSVSHQLLVVEAPDCLVRQPLVSCICFCFCALYSFAFKKKGEKKTFSLSSIGEVVVKEVKCNLNFFPKLYF